MRKKTTAAHQDGEISALDTVYKALKDLDDGARVRVINYVAGKLEMKWPRSHSAFTDDVEDHDASPEDVGTLRPTKRVPVRSSEAEDDSEGSDEGGNSGTEGELSGISPIAQKWIKRNGITVKSISKIFSLGIEEIDLVAQSVPGKKIKERMHNIFLLKGIASYLGTGVARFTHAKIKETCLHYRAWDQANFAKCLKSFSADVSSTREDGYTLTPKGLHSATELIKQMVSVEKG